jgi:hypothetical protein
MRAKDLSHDPVCRFHRLLLAGTLHVPDFCQSILNEMADPSDAALLPVQVRSFISITVIPVLSGTSCRKTGR